MEPASLTTWLQPLQFTTQSIQSVWKCQVLFRILQTFKNLNLLFIGQMIKSQSEKCLAQNESNISVGVHVGSSLVKVKDTHLMNNNQPVAEILCWRLHCQVHLLVPKTTTLKFTENICFVEFLWRGENRNKTNEEHPRCKQFRNNADTLCYKPFWMTFQGNLIRQNAFKSNDRSNILCTRLLIL